MLQREVGLAQAKCSNTAFMLQQAQRHMFDLNKRVCQATSDHDELKSDQQAIREHIHDPAYDGVRDALPHHARTSVALQLMTEGMRVDKAVRKQEDKLWDIDRKQDAAASDIRKYTKKLHHLQGWGEEVISVELAHQVAIRQVEMMREVPAAAANTARHSMCLVEVEQEAVAVRKRFRKDIWPKVSTFEQEKVLYEAIKLQRKQLAPFHDEGCAVLPLMEAHVVDAACNDPGAALLPHLILPLLREQIGAKAAEAALQDAKSGSGTSSSNGSRHARATESVMDLEAHYSTLIQTSNNSKQTKEMVGQLKLIAEAQTARKAHRFCGPNSLLYGAYMDDIMLEQIYQRPQEVALENSVSNTFIGVSEADSAWLTLLFCSYM